MKVTIDCTPEEAPTFLGLPDLGKVQEEAMDAMAAMAARMREAVAEVDMEALQKTFWAGFSTEKESKGKKE